jgi:dienelactone hydrolase
LPADAQYARQEIIGFESASVSVPDFLNGKKGTPLQLAGHLRLPKAGPGKRPAAILLHGAGGVGGAAGATGVWADLLNSVGVATFTIDSFAGRGANTREDVAKVSPLTRVPDAFGALKVLAKHPLVDPQRIVVIGFSHGSMAALYSNLERFQKTHGTPDVQFAAHISVYGVCGTHLREDENLTRPVLFLHGVVDDFVPIGPCREYAARLLKAGRNARMIEYPDAHHGFVAPQYGPVTKLAELITPAWCRFSETDNGIVVNVATQKPLTSTDSCWRKGVSLGYNEVAAKKVQDDVKDFLRDTLKIE